MPKRIPGRGASTEQRVATAVHEQRTKWGWTYEELAARMTAAGCKMHATGIYKTEKEGRRITVEELVAYATVFKTTPESLLQYGGKHEPRTSEYWRDLLFAERLLGFLAAIRSSWNEIIDGLRAEVRHNAELQMRVQERLDQSLAWQRRELLEHATSMGIDVSTEEKLERAVWEEWESTQMAVADEVLRKVRKRR